MRADEVSRWRVELTVVVEADSTDSARQLARNLATVLRSKKHPSLPRVRVVEADVIEVRSV